MADVPKPFWYFVGPGVLVVLLAIGYRVYTGSGGTIDVEGVKVEVDNAQQGISAAQSIVDQLTKQAASQSSEIEALESQLSQAQARIRQLVADIQRLPASAATKSSAQAALNESFAKPMPPIARVDAQLLSKAQAQLNVARTSVEKLTTQIAKR